MSNFPTKDTLFWFISLQNDLTLLGVLPSIYTNDLPGIVSLPKRLDVHLHAKQLR